MTIKDQIEKDIKVAMLGGEKQLVTTLRGLKSAILYAEVAAGNRDSGLPNDDVITLLRKELKKRQESATLFRQGGNIEKAEAEEAEQVVIEGYLPPQLSAEVVTSLVQQEAERLGITDMQSMGQLIGAVKQATKGEADGALIAKAVKEYLSK